MWGWWGPPIQANDPDLPVPKPTEPRKTWCSQCKKEVDMQGVYVLSHMGTMHVECLCKAIDKDIVRVLGERRGIRDADADRAKREEAEREIDSSNFP